MSHAPTRHDARIDGRASAALGASRAAQAAAALVATVEAGWHASWAQRGTTWLATGAGSRPGTAAPAVTCVAAATAFVVLWMQEADGATMVGPALVAVAAAGWLVLGRVAGARPPA